MSTGAAAVLAALFGAILGSFFNVVIHRLPRGESLLKPGSRCPECGEAIKPWHNIPIVGWLMLRGKCANCGEPISPRYPLVEALTAALFALVVIVIGAEKEAWLGLALVAFLVPLTFIDLDHRILPNKITGPAAIVAVILVLVIKPDDIVEHLIAGAAGAGFFLVAVLAYPRGMGVGDVKLAGVLGLFLGREVGAAILIALLSGTVISSVILARKGVKEGRKTAIPFGPFLALGGLVGLLVGDEIVDWYLDTFA